MTAGLMVGVRSGADPERIHIPAPPGSATRLHLPCDACRRCSVAVFGPDRDAHAECVLCGQRRPHRPERTS